MRRRLAYLLIWSIGTVATVGACWLGLQSVLSAAGPIRTTPLTAEELREPAPGTASGPGLAEPPEPVADTESTPPSAFLPPPIGESTTSSATSSASGTPAATGQPVLTPSSVPSTSAGTGTDWIPVPNGWGGTAYERTFHLVGGDVTFWAEQFDVHVISAHVNPGYVLVPTRYDIRSLRISLISTTAISRVYVTWRDGPYAEVTESVA